MSFAFPWRSRFSRRRRTRYGRPAGAVVLNRRAGESGGKAPGGHIEAGLQPALPRCPGVGGLRKEPAGRLEKPGASPQLLAALGAAVLARRDRLRLGPARQHVAAQTRGTFGDQGSHGGPERVPIQPPKRPGAQATQPAVQGGRMRMACAQARDRLAQAFGGSVRGGVGRAGRLDHRPRVTLEGRDLQGQDAEASAADGAAAQRHRRRTRLDAATARPVRPPRHPTGSVDQRPDRPACQTPNLGANRFAFDGNGPQGIIRDGDGNGDRLLSGTPRGTGVGRTRTSLPPESPNATPATPSPQTTCSPLAAHPPASPSDAPSQVSMSFSISSSGNPEPVRRECR